MSLHLLVGDHFLYYRGVDASAVCIYPANNSVDDATGRFGRNGGVFDIFRTLLVNPNTGTQTTSGYVEVGTSFCRQYLHRKRIATSVLHVESVIGTACRKCYRDCM